MTRAGVLAAAEPSPFGRKGRAAIGLTIALTWSLMVLGALTRASLAGISCPDWPLCHGYLVPPTDPAAFPASPLYAVHRVYLEFSHRVLAGLVAIAVVPVGVMAWRRGHRRLAAGLWGLLAVQVGLGAATVWLQNAPYTVVLHLSAALGFLALLVILRAAADRAPGERTGRLQPRYQVLLAGLTAQLLVGAYVASSAAGLACTEFPRCNGGEWLPARWTSAVAWQLGHRGLGTLLVTGVLLLWFAARHRSAAERRTAALLAVGMGAQALLGAVNVWLRLAPLASAAHLGLAVALFALVVGRMGRGFPDPVTEPALAGPALPNP